MAGARSPRKRKAAPGAGIAASPSSPAPEELGVTVPALRDYQTELEMKNEELRRAQLELEEQREKDRKSTRLNSSH